MCPSQSLWLSASWEAGIREVSALRTTPMLGLAFHLMILLQKTVGNMLRSWPSLPLTTCKKVFPQNTRSN